MSAGVTLPVFVRNIIHYLEGTENAPVSDENLCENNRASSVNRGENQRTLVNES